MALIFTSILDRFKGFWTRITLSQRIFVSGIAALVLVVFLGLILWLNQPDYQVLYSNLSMEDANRVVQMLQKDKVPYKLENNGSTVLVEANRVYDLRLLIAGEGNLVGQGIGFEIFDDIKVGQTDFVQKINYQRALQGELSRTISEFPGIESARVHLVVPQKSLFLEEQQKPSASVVVKLLDGKPLDTKTVQSIVNLLVMSVEGLDKNKVSISDSNGKVLYFPNEDTLAGLSSTQMENKITIQQNLERRIEELLGPVTGVGKIIARVNADLDFNQKTIRKELYDPDKTVLRSEQKSEETTKGQSALAGGSPDINFRADGANSGVSTQESTRETKTANFEIDKEEHNIIGSVGDINRLSIAVIVDGTYEKNADTGEMIFTPRSAEELQRIRQLVVNAVGFDSGRGDSIEVSSISFGGIDIISEPSMAQIIMDYALRMGKPILNALLVLLFLLMIVRPVILSIIRPKVQGELLEGLEGLPDGEERLALIEAEDELDAVDALKKIDDIKAHALQLCEQNMEQAVSILRSWMKPTNEGAHLGRAA